MHVATVLQVKEHSPGLVELTVARGDVRFIPGDCVAIFNEAGVSRPYSISSGQEEPGLRFLIRRMVGGEVSDWLARRQPGDQISFSPPFGWFRPGQSGGDGERCVFVATGTGVAPFVSFLRSRPDARPELCLYGVRSAADAVDIAFLESRCTTVLCVSRDAAGGFFNGRVTDQLARIPLGADFHYYLCGLDAMIDDVSTFLEHNGIHFSHIHREVFFNA